MISSIPYLVLHIYDLRLLLFLLDVKQVRVVAEFLTIEPISHQGIHTTSLQNKYTSLFDIIQNPFRNLACCIRLHCHILALDMGYQTCFGQKKQGDIKHDALLLSDQCNAASRVPLRRTHISHRMPRSWLNSQGWSLFHQ